MPKSCTSSAVWAVVIVLFAIGVWMIASNWKCDALTSNEPYVSYESSPYNFARCPMSYRIYDDANLQLPAGRDRCASVCGRQDGDYDFTQYEYYCPHNCRQYGVSVCDQGKIM